MSKSHCLEYIDLNRNFPTWEDVNKTKQQLFEVRQNIYFKKETVLPFVPLFFPNNDKSITF